MRVLVRKVSYLLNPQAIAEVLSSTEEAPNIQVTANDIDTWLKVNSWNKEFFDKVPPEEKQNKDNWLKQVHGADVLKRIFSHFSSTRIEYSKTADGLRLTQWILKNSPDELREVAECILEVLEKGKKRLKSEAS